MRAFPEPNDIALACLCAFDNRSCDNITYRILALRQAEFTTYIFERGSHDRYMVRLEVRTLQQTINRHGPHLIAKKQDHIAHAKTSVRNQQSKIEQLVPDQERQLPAGYGHFTTGGSDERMESTLPPVRSPKIVPRS